MNLMGVVTYAQVADKTENSQKSSLKKELMVSRGSTASITISPFFVACPPHMMIVKPHTHLPSLRSLKSHKKYKNYDNIAYIVFSYPQSSQVNLFASWTSGQNNSPHLHQHKNEHLTGFASNPSSQNHSIQRMFFKFNPLFLVLTFQIISVSQVSFNMRETEPLKPRNY